MLTARLAKQMYRETQGYIDSCDENHVDIDRQTDRLRIRKTGEKRKERLT